VKIIEIYRFHHNWMSTRKTKCTPVHNTSGKRHSRYRGTLLTCTPPEEASHVLVPHVHAGRVCGPVGLDVIGGRWLPPARPCAWAFCFFFPRVGQELFHATDIAWMLGSGERHPDFLLVLLYYVMALSFLSFGLFAFAQYGLNIWIAY
jgi:hypothetical protein